MQLLRSSHPWYIKNTVVPFLATLNIPKDPKNEIQQIVKATVQGAEGDILYLTMLAKANDLTILIYSPEGELLAIKGNGKNKVKATYTLPS